MIVHVLAVDYDGTIADHGRVSDTTAAALMRVRESGRRVLLVTGRLLPDLREVCPRVDELFDAVVVENGAVLYLPDRREVKLLADAPEPALVDALERRRVPFDLGSVIVGTAAAFAEPALAAIREAGVERTLVFNKGSLMLLPGGVTKGTGLDAALDTLRLSRHNTVAIGDAENDHALLAVAEFAIAVEDAVPALRDRADHVTPEPGPRGVVRFIELHLLDDLAALVPRVTRHDLPIGEDGGGNPVRVPAHRTRLLVVGPSESGKSTLTGALVERLVDVGRSFCLIDPEGDYQMLTELSGVVVLGGKADSVLPTADELDQLLRRPRSGLVLNLSTLRLADKVEYAAKTLAAVGAARNAGGMPHWLIIDEAHHVFPRDGSPATELVHRDPAPLCLITLDVDKLAREMTLVPNVVTSTDLPAFDRALAGLANARRDLSPLPRISGEPLGQGEAAIAWLDGSGTAATRFRVTRPRIEHRRHAKKYTEGELPPDRSFYFRGEQGTLNLRAVNLVRFCELAEGVDEATFTYHLRRGDYSRWLREEIKDPELADEIDSIAAALDVAPAETRRRALGAIRRRYAV